MDIRQQVSDRTDRQEDMEKAFSIKKYIDKAHQTPDNRQASDNMHETRENEHDPRQ